MLPIIVSVVAIVLIWILLNINRWIKEFIKFGAENYDFIYRAIRMYEPHGTWFESKANKGK